MKVHKDNQHLVSLSPFSWQGKRYLMVSVGLYAAFDPEGGASSLRTEQDFWKEAPELFAAIGQPPVMDMGLPKPGAEVLAAGMCRTPGKSLVQAQEVAFRVGNVRRRFSVFGDRQRLPGGGVSEPLPFAYMPLVWERAFGGPAFSANLSGKGLDADNNASVLLPNLEDPEHLLLSPNDHPHPVCPLPVPLDNPVRRNMSGTYDQHWLDTRWPAYPDDCRPAFFHSAQPEQRLRPQANGYPFFRGDEDIEIIGMRHDFPHIRSRLPEVRIRAFVLTTERFIPFADNGEGETKAKKKPLPYSKDLDAEGLFREVELRCDTVWLLPDMMGAYVLRRGLLPVEDDEMDDVLRVLVVTEKPSNAPHDLAYYREELRRRAYPAVEIDLAPFVEAQGQTAKAVKMARDVPKLLERVKKNALGQGPDMPLSLGDISHSAKKTLATGRTTLDTVEKEMLSLREQFSHLMTFDLSMFTQMRAMITEQEAQLDNTMSDLSKKMSEADANFKQQIASMKSNFQAKLAVPPGSTPVERAGKEAIAARLQAEFAKLDDFSVEGMLCEPQPLNPWHDRGFPLVISARRRLTRDDALLARLASMGLDGQTLDLAWVGHNPEPLTDTPEAWGLPPSPDGKTFTLPPGLYVPRFKGKALCALRVYPQDGASFRGLGEDVAALAMVPGSDESPHSLPASYPGGAVVAVPDALCALFVEQEAGDFCHIVAVADPAQLAEIDDLPPLAPDLPEDEGGLPLVVVLPPLPEGSALFAPWKEAHPEVIALHLPEHCPHVLALADNGHRFRRLLLDVLPQDLAARHDFYFPLPPKNKPPEPFTLNMPLPDKEELQGRILALVDEIRAHFPDPQKMLAETLAKHKPALLAKLEGMPLRPEDLAKAKAALDAPIPPPSPPKTVAEITRNTLAGLDNMKTRLVAAAPPELRPRLLAELERAEAETIALGEKLAPLDALQADGMAKIEALKEGKLPDEVQAAFDDAGMDPNALRLLSREEVQDILAGDKNLERRNLQGLDLSGLDFSSAHLAHALCAKTSFAGCAMRGADFTFTLANEADFSGANLQGAEFKHTVLQKALLKKTDFSTARLELTTLGECDLHDAIFDRAEIKLCNFGMSVLDGASFQESLLSLCAFSEISADKTDFSRIRAFKCLFQKAELTGALFCGATLNECLFQASNARGLALGGAELRKFYTDADTDLSGADFSGADMREASLRMTRLCNADFYNARLENALVSLCDLSRARLDGLRASGCRFVKCDLSGADLSGTTLINGAMRKCRISGADLTESNLYAANLRDMTANEGTRLQGANLKKTLLAGKEEALHDAARRRS
ncbi:DUF2169 domain-containing protein [Desulfovibrio sp. OttesenSCG-928-M14]|nr:DUF2169 domain-containing protein [Desulfovibrio sp. OttesenSCG-928-M14]